MFERSRAYTRNEIHAQVGGSKRACLPTRNGVVVAACLLRSLNPDTPRVVLCGTGPRNGAMGALLARQRIPVPMFTKEGVGRWVHEGLFVVDGALVSGARYERIVARSGRAPASVSIIVLMKPAWLLRTADLSAVAREG